jgi:hypothetical protein
VPLPFLPITLSSLAAVEAAVGAVAVRVDLELPQGLLQRLARHTQSQLAQASQVVEAHQPKA